MFGLIQKIVGSRNDRLIKKINKTVQKINALEPSFVELTDEELKNKTLEFKQLLADGKTVDDILPEAFAAVREASKRTKGMRHYDVQLIGGVVLHSGKVAEMRTGEGKTLVATLPAYLNALEGKGVHVITVNDYLAARDAHIMEEIYNFLGMSVGVIIADLSPTQRKEAYACDITYGTNNEFGFDYLRDNMAFSIDGQVQRRNFVVIDEVDSILIDEARTPLIISGQADDSSEMYRIFNKLVPYIQKQEKEELEEDQEEKDFYVDEKSKNAYLTETGHIKVENMLKKEGVLSEEDNLYSPKNIMKMHYLNACLRAHSLYQLNVDYIVKDQEIVIIDESTGRAMPGRRWSDGLHQAIEAKEDVKVNAENQTLASITFQNFFKLYNKLAGMTGTADTEAFELHSIYGLEVVVIPTNKPIIRKDHHDAIYGSAKEKFVAIVDDIKERVAKGQPVLIGTASIDTSEYLSTLMRKKKVKHNVLNAKQHEQEAGIIAQAGLPGNVTIATNMAGRGTDIILGGNWEVEVAALGEEATQKQIDDIKTAWQERNEAVKKAGGLCIIGSERHDSRRVDNQLRGRAARQGDPGESKFYLSMDDNLLRIFASPTLAERVKKGLTGGESLAFGFMSKFISKAQGKVEGYHFDIRKNLLDYDNVVNEQRKVIYKQRQDLLNNDDVSEILADIREDVAEQVFYEYVPKGSMSELWDLEGLQTALKNDFLIDINFEKMLEENESCDDDDIKKAVREAITFEYSEKMKNLELSAIQNFEKVSLLQSLDSHWREHLSSIDHLRSSINLRGYAQKDPKNEYKKEAFELFSDMLDNFKYEVITALAKIRIANEEEAKQAEEEWKESVSDVKAQHESVIDNTSNEEAEKPKQQPVKRQGSKVKRNDPCPCGSGKKFKQCHGKMS